MAASIAIFAVLCTLFFTGYLNNREINYKQLRGEVARIKNTTDQLNHKINGLNGVKGNDNLAKYRGTGFAISANGYIVTNFHVIDGADSVYVQDADGKSYKTKVIYSEPSTDIAVLEITDSSFKTFRCFTLCL